MIGFHLEADVHHGGGDLEGARRHPRLLQDRALQRQQPRLQLLFQQLKKGFNVNS